MKAVIPAAGLGTRFLPASKSNPKEMIPLVDKPAIQYVVEEAVQSGITDILIITGRGKRAIEDHFDHAVELEQRLAEKGRSEELERLRELVDMADIHYIRQKEPRGLGHAILCARNHVGDEDFAVLLGDDVVMPGPNQGHATKALMDSCKRHGAGVMGVQEVPREHVDRYGILEVGAPLDDGAAPIHRVVEKPAIEEAKSRLAAIGRYAFTPDLFDALERTPPGVNHEIQLADAVMLMLPDTPVHALPIEGRRFDLGSPLSWIESNVVAALDRPEYGPALRQYLTGLLDGGEGA